MTNAINKYNYLRELYIQTGDERILREANTLAKEILRANHRTMNKERVIMVAFNTLRIMTLIIGLYIIVWSAANLVQSFEFKLVYAAEICFISFLVSCGIDWLQAKVKRM